MPDDIDPEATRPPTESAQGRVFGPQHRLPLPVYRPRDRWRRVFWLAAVLSLVLTAAIVALAVVVLG